MSFTGDGVAQHSRPSKLTNSAKVNQLEEFTVRVPLDGDAHVSPFAQAKVDNLDTSMRAGPRGPTTIDDPVARERISHCEFSLLDVMKRKLTPNSLSSRERHCR